MGSQPSNEMRKETPTSSPNIERVMALNDTSDEDISPSIPTKGNEYLTGYKLLAIMVAITLVGFLMLLDSSIIATWTFLSFFAVFELGSVICGAASSSTMLIVGRAIAGMGASGLLNGGYTIVHASVAPARQTGLLGILLGFYINLPCGVVVALCLFFLALPDHHAKKARQLTVVESLGKLDLLGFAIFAGFSVQILLALNWGGSRFPWNSATVIGLLCGSAGALIVFVIWEHYMGKEAMIPLSLIGRRVIWSSCLNYCFFAGWLLSSTYYLPIYFQAVRNATPTMSGVNLLPAVIGNMLFAGLTGGLVGRIGYYLPFAVASGVLSIIGSGLLTTLTPTTSTGKWVGYQIIQGVGGGFGIQIPVIAVQNDSTKEEISIATALVVFSQQFGGAVFLSLAQVVFSTSLRDKLAMHAPDTDAEAVIAAGASGARTAVPAGSLSGVLLAYTQSVDNVLYLTTGAAGGALLFAFGMGWISIKAKEADGIALEKTKASSSPTATERI
ncbi:MAG: hypothetical protein Q9178_001820 [Gyalolechia marmorata]